MQKSMLEINVATADKLIVIEGPQYKGGPDDIVRIDSITITPDQVDTLIQWLKEAKEELQGT